MRLFTFSEVKSYMELGSCIAKQSWNDKKMFVCKQISSSIDNATINKLQSLPISAKQILTTRNKEPIYYENQIILIHSDGTITSWHPSSNDIFANDYYIYTINHVTYNWLFELIHENNQLNNKILILQNNIRNDINCIDINQLEYLERYKQILETRITNAIANIKLSLVDISIFPDVSLLMKFITINNN